jgi:hypothetical protein
MADISTRQDAARAIGDYAAYLLTNECGLPRDTRLNAAAERLAGEVRSLVEEGELSVQELRFLISSSIDIVPVPDLGAAARDAGFEAASCERMQTAHGRLMKAMRERE